MDVIQSALLKIKKMEASVNKYIQASINQNKTVLIGDQTDQLDKGKDSFSITIVPSYASSTKKIKLGKGQPIDRVTLKDTGGFYRSFDIQANTTQATISTTSPHYKFLVAHYSTNKILGIQRGNMKDFVISHTLPEIRKQFKTILKT